MLTVDLGLKRQLRHVRDMLGKKNNYNKDRGHSTFWVSVSEIKPNSLMGCGGVGAGGVRGWQNTNYGDHLSKTRLRFGQVRTNTLTAIIHL